MVVVIGEVRGSLNSRDSNTHIFGIRGFTQCGLLL